MDIKVNEENPRKINAEKLVKLKQSIEEFPKMLELRPIVVDKEGVILGGNMRYRALKELGWEIKPEWIRVAEGLSNEERRRFIIEDNVMFGDWDWKLLEEDWSMDELAEWGVDVPKGMDDYYTREIKAPIYNPSLEAPELSELVDVKKTNELIADIKKSKVSDGEKEFLLRAAERHLVFNYAKVADYYAHASSEMKELMEKSALVIIDYDKAIEYGFVELAKAIMQIQGEDYEE